MSLQKTPRYENKKLTALANGMDCCGCGCSDGTIVMAHSNSHLHGKGKGMKAHDCFVAALCHRCHAWLDFGTGLLETGRMDWDPIEKDEFFRRAHDETMLTLWRNGKIKVA